MVPEVHLSAIPRRPVLGVARRTPPGGSCQGDRERHLAELPMQLAAAQGTTVYDAEVEISHADGTRRTAWGSAAPLWNEQGEVHGAIGAFVDITCRKRAEESSRLAQQWLLGKHEQQRQPAAADPRAGLP